MAPTTADCEIAHRSPLPSAPALHAPFSSPSPRPAIFGLIVGVCSGSLGTSLAGPFVLGASGANDCPAGSFAITTLAHCQAAVLGTPGVPLDSMTRQFTISATYPKGCSKSALLTYLNPHPVGGANSDYTPICSSCAITAAPTALATATPSYSNGRRPPRRVRFSGGPAQVCRVGCRRRRLDRDRRLRVELHVWGCWSRLQSGCERLLDRSAHEHDRPNLQLGIYPAHRAAQRHAPRGHRQALVPLEDHPDVRPLMRRRCAPANALALGFRSMIAFAATSSTSGCTARCRRASRRSLR